MRKDHVMANGKKVINIVFLVALAISGMAVQKPASKPVVIGYVGGFRGLLKTETIAAEKLTHINYAFVNVKNHRAVLDKEKTDSVNFRRLNQLKRKNPDLKILISIGGWSWSENFSDAVLTDTARKAFAASAVAIIRKYQLDGVDIDWEYPGMPGEEGNVYRPEDKQNFTLMFQALREELNTLQKQTGKKKLLTTAVGGFPQFLDNTEMGKAQEYLDLINLMTYDLYSSTNTTHHANLYSSKLNKSGNSADIAVKAYLAAGVPAEKLVLGVPFYGRHFKVAGNTAQGLGDQVLAQVTGKGYSVLKDSLVNKSGFTAYRDEEAKAPYLYNQATKVFISYEDEWSLQNKCRYVLDQKMAGVMFWEYDSDPKGYLLNTITSNLKNKKVK